MNKMMKKSIFSKFAILAAVACMPAVAMADDSEYFHVPNVQLNDKGEGTVEVYLNTASDKVNAFDLNIYLPGGCVIEKNSRGKYVFTHGDEEILGDRSTQCTYYEKKDPPYFRIVDVSVAGDYILPGDHMVFKFNITAPEGYDTAEEGHLGEICIGGTTSDPVSRHPADAYFTVIPYDSSTSGIGNVMVDAAGEEEETIFDLMGRKYNRPLLPGVYIINGQKVAVTE